MSIDEYLVITTSADLLRIAAGELVYAEADGNYTSLVLADGERRVVTLQLGQLERLIAIQMPQAAQGFVRIGKSLIVRLDSVRYIHPSRGVLELSNPAGQKHELSASREALRLLKEMIERSLR
jgi:two-component system LytT family response regulator